MGGVLTLVEHGSASVGPSQRKRRSLSPMTRHMGVFAVMVGGSIAQWEHTLEVCEPVLDSLTFANYGL